MSFFLDDIPYATTFSESRDYAMLHQLGCRVCPLAKIRANKHPAMLPTGADHPLVYIIGEGPGRTEDEQNEQFVGESGQILRARIPRKFCNVVRFNNVIRTRPPSNRTPTRVEIECCFPAGIEAVPIGHVKSIYRRWYDGPLVKVTTAKGRVLTGTPNHPIFTTRGRVALGAVKEGDYAFCARTADAGLPPNVDDKPTTIDKIFGALHEPGQSKWVSGTLDFHGDGMIDGEVDIVRTNGELTHDLQFGPYTKHHFAEPLFTLTDATSGLLVRSGSLDADFGILSMIASCAPLRLGARLHPQGHLFGGCSYSDVVGLKNMTDGTRRDVKCLGEFFGTLASDVSADDLLCRECVPSLASPSSCKHFALGSENKSGFEQELLDRCAVSPGKALERGYAAAFLVELDEIVFVETVSDFRGHVFNLETLSHKYVAQGFVVSNCRPSVTADIERTRPRVIIGLGNVPLEWVSGFTGITAWRGRRMPVRVGKHACWYYPLIHPASILHKQQTSRRAAEDDLFIFGMDLRRAFSEVDELPVPDVHDHARARSGIETISGHKTDDIDRLEDVLEWAADLPIVGVDYETRGLRPYAASAVLLSVAVSDGDKSVAFPFDHPGAGWSDKKKPLIRELWADFIRRARGVKVAHNLSFELEWTGMQFGVDLVRAGRWECTQVQASVLDERSRGSSPGPMALDFLTQQYFGLSVKDVFPVDQTNLHDTPLEVVLRYNCPDARYAALLWREQRAEIERLGLEQVYDLSLRRVPTVVLSQMRGVPIDQAVVEELLTKYDARIKKVEKEIAALDVVRKYERVHGVYNPLSNQHAIKLFHGMLGRSECEIVDKRTKKSRLSVDESVLAQIDHPLAKLSLELRKADKMRSTYVEPLRVGSQILYPDGCIHTSYNTTFTDTSRLSSDSPNIQNFPKRTEEGREIRRAFVTESRDQVILSADYGQIQPRIIAMMSMDARFSKMLWERHDIHGEWAERIAYAYPAIVGGKKFIKDKGAIKIFRQTTKSGWVLALFFGAGLPTCSRHLKIPESVLSPLYDDFWEEFSGVKEWQDNLIATYKKFGYILGPTGRRRRGPIEIGQMINYPIQNGEAEIVLDCMSRMSETEDPDLQPEINVHDDLTSVRVLEDRVDDVAEKMITMMLDVPFEWARVVPISVEVSVGKNWMQMKEIGTFSSDEWFGEDRK